MKCGEVFFMSMSLQLDSFILFLLIDSTSWPFLNAYPTLPYSMIIPFGHIQTFSPVGSSSYASPVKKIQPPPLGMGRSYWNQRVSRVKSNHSPMKHHPGIIQDHDPQA